jgi:predicted N-acetyltransferase YhbS
LEAAPRAAHAAQPVIVVESPAHRAAIEHVIDMAFGPGRFAKTSERVRENGAVHRYDLSRVALADGAPVGCCRLHDVSVGGRPALFLGPLAVEPSRQHVGLGAKLVTAALEACRREGKVVLAVGAANFFRPLGFELVPEDRIVMPGPIDPRRFLWFSPMPGASDGLRGPISAPRAAIPA